jgi:hypothetical protein
MSGDDCNRRPLSTRRTLKDIVERIVAPLVGLRVSALAREADLLVVQFADSHELRIACAWRVAGPSAILAASGDLFTPADPNAELETFDWDVPGASWWDIRMAEVGRLLDQSVVVTTFLADSYGGVRLVCTGGMELEIFPNSSPSPHVETEFWRLIRSGKAEDSVVVGTAGIELVQPT